MFALAGFQSSYFQIFQGSKLPIFAFSVNVLQHPSEHVEMKYTFVMDGEGTFRRGNSDLIFVN